MFGSHCHELLSQQATLKARKLAIEEMYNSTLWLYWKVYWSSKNIFQKQCEIGWHQQFSKIYGTITMNYGSVNAIIPGCSQAFQMTVSTSHPVKADGIIFVMDSCHFQSLNFFFLLQVAYFRTTLQRQHWEQTGWTVALCVDDSSLKQTKNSYQHPRKFSVLDHHTIPFCLENEG